jgi:hypothetical protein
MKKMIFSVLAFAAILASCSSNEDLASVAIVSSSTSATVAAYVAENYPATSIVSTTSNGSTVTATLNTGEALTFSTSGTVIAYANNAANGLAADSLIVSDSITTDNDGKHHHRGGHGGRPDDHGGPGHGGPGQRPDSANMGGPGHGHERHFENEIAVDSLPLVINDYVLANYSGYKVIHAQVDTICQGVVTEVLVCVTKQEPIKLVFDAVGTFIFKGERIKYTEVPAEVSAAVTANYSTYKVKNRSEKFTYPDGSIQYKVFMNIDKTRKSVTFNADGTVSCEK